MKRKSYLIITLILAFALAACGQSAPAAPAPAAEAPAVEAPAAEKEPAAEAPAAEEPAAETQAENAALPAPYAAILERYAQAIREGWDREKCDEQGVNTLVSVVCSPEVNGKIGYALIDLDGDGTQELLIGPCDDSGLVLELFALDGDEAKEVFTGWERNSYVYRTDGRFYNHGSNSAYNSGDFLYSYASGALRFEEGVVIDAWFDENEPYFSVSDDSWDVSGAEKISEETFMERATGYQSMAQQIEMTEIA